MEVIKKGSQGDYVKLLQNYLGITLTGIFDDTTEKAVLAYQKEQHLKQDGVVGSRTWALLGHGPTNRIKQVILHCSATPEGREVDVDTIRLWHLARGFSDIGYHFVIYLDGSIHIGRNIDTVGAHCTGLNSNSAGICYIGGLDKSAKKAKDTRTSAQKKSLLLLVHILMNEYSLTLNDIHCHNEYSDKDCPSFSITNFRKEL